MIGWNKNVKYGGSVDIELFHYFLLIKKVLKLFNTNCFCATFKTHIVSY